jgi:hypothetical protein
MPQAITCHMTKEFKDGLLYAFYEYLLIISPVGIYVGLEALHKNSFAYFFASPEWSIATIFLSAVGILNFHNEIESAGKKLKHSYLGILIISNVLIIVVSVLNAYLSMESPPNRDAPSKSITILRQILFLFTTVLFFIAVAGSKSFKLKNKKDG